MPSYPAPTGTAVPLPSDPHVERLRKHQVWQIAYCSRKPASSEPQATMVGRAYTVNGPDIYLNALEGIKPGEVYVQSGCHDTDAVFSPGWTHAYLAPRGAVGCVVDGGVYKSFECGAAAVPIFAKFYSPSPAINREATSSIGTTIEIGGVTVSPGDIVMADGDGVIIIPKSSEDDLFAHLDGFCEANGMFGKIAASALAKGTPLTEEPALASMFARKYANPESYWRDYEGWWAEWKGKCEFHDSGTTAFYSGPRA